MDIEPLYLTKIVKIGTSKGIVIPVPVLKALELDRGDVVAFAITHPGHIIARKLGSAEVEQLKPKFILI